MKLNEAIEVLNEAKYEVEPKADFNYTLTDEYVIFPTVEDVVKCFDADETKNYQYIKATSRTVASIGIPGSDNDNDILVCLAKKTKEGYWVERDDFYYESNYQVNEKFDIMLNISFPVLNQKGKRLSFDTFMKRRAKISAKMKAYDKYCEEYNALAVAVKKRMTEMARIFKINV